MEPSSYHRQVSHYLEHNEPELWRWMGNSQEEHQSALQLHLLKTCYQLSTEAHGPLHDLVADVCNTLQIAPHISLYQATRTESTNVSIYMGKDEAYIIFQGQVLDLLSDVELKAVLGHELSHYLLLQREDRRYWIASQILDRLAMEPDTTNVWISTAIRFQQHTEIYADRGAFRACGDIAPCISSLVKLETGLKQVHAESYLKQADEIFANDIVISDGLSHPQAYIRARALQLHRDDASNAEHTIAGMLAGPLGTDKLDILGQLDVQKITRGVLRKLLAPAWFQTDAVLSLARKYFEDFSPASKPDENDSTALPAGHQLDEYLSFVLLDFATADTSLEEYPVMATLRLSGQLGVAETFERMLIKEIKLKKTQLSHLKKDAEAMLSKIEANSNATAPR